MTKKGDIRGRYGVRENREDPRWLWKIYHDAYRECPLDGMVLRTADVVGMLVAKSITPGSTLIDEKDTRWRVTEGYHLQSGGVFLRANRSTYSLRRIE